MARHSPRMSWTTFFGDDRIDAVILSTPTQLHASQALATMDAGKHVQIEIPLADSWPDALAVATRADGDGPHLHGGTHAPI